MKTLRRALEFLRITDEDGNLSLTHAALVFAAVCIWRGIHVDLAEFGTFALALGAYQAKKYLARSDAEPGPSVDLKPVQDRLAVLEGHLKTILNAPALERFGLVKK